MRSLIGAGAALLVGSAALAAPNGFEVQASDVPAHPVGQRMEKGATLTLPQGSKVTLIERKGGFIGIRECGGQYEGPVEKCPAPVRKGEPSRITGGTRTVVPTK